MRNLFIEPSCSFLRIGPDPSPHFLPVTTVIWHLATFSHSDLVGWNSFPGNPGVILRPRLFVQGFRLAPALGHFYESALSLSDGIPFTVGQTLELNTVCLQDTKFFFREDFSGAFDLKCIFYFSGPRVESPLFQYIEHNEKGEILLRLGIVILFVLIRFYRLIFQIPSMGSGQTSLTEPPDN